ncbi:MAG: monovalent cation/H(+) antiporter subunit G [Pseudomonadota bacterium]
MIDLIALVIKMVGLVFLVLATLGLLRFEDVFQRMHAATKAGTLGAGLVLIGTMLNKGTFDAAMTGTLALLFLILTIPVASHILARAAYMSGSQLAGIGPHDDALAGTLRRAVQPLERSIEDLAFDVATPPVQMPPAAEELGVAYPTGAARSGPRSLKDMIAPERVRFAALGAGAPKLAKRAADFAARAELPLTAVVALDTRYAEQTSNKAETLRLMRDQISTWLPNLNKLSEESKVPIDLIYKEGDAEALMAGVGDHKEFLVLPTKGWADHEVGVKTTLATREPDSLLRIVAKHPGPVMYAVDETMAGAVAVQFDGSFNVWRGIDLALVEELWDMSELRVYGYVDQESREEIESRCAMVNVPVHFITPKAGETKQSALPSHMMDGVVGVILPDLPRPLHVDWYGLFWQDRIAQGWRGDVLVWT